MQPAAQAGAVLTVSPGLVLTLLLIAGIGWRIVRHLTRIEFSAAQASDAAAAVARSVADLASTVARVAERQQEHGEELAVVKALVNRDAVKGR
jgi:hypothetical protein